METTKLEGEKEIKYFSNLLWEVVVNSCNIFVINPQGIILVQ